MSRSRERKWIILFWNRHIMIKRFGTPVLVLATLFNGGCSLSSISWPHIGMVAYEEGQVPDDDQDGVTDDQDQCPSTPAETVVDAKGCALDEDGDGVVDGVDQCPGTPQGTPVDQRGCPADGDGDGVWDDQDQCPDTPSGTVVDLKGCPLDSDFDGVLDADDRCPGTPRGHAVDSTGCEPRPETIQRMLPSLKGINFETDSAQLRPSAYPVLDRVRDVLMRYPQARVRVIGHTDDRGSDKYNLDLSWRRARAAMSYLIQRGIAPERLEAEGRGERQPIASNKTAEGRARNRRVEFQVINDAR